MSLLSLSLLVGYISWVLYVELALHTWNEANLLIVNNLSCVVSLNILHLCVFKKVGYNFLFPLCFGLGLSARVLLAL